MRKNAVRAVMLLVVLGLAALGAGAFADQRAAEGTTFSAEFDSAVGLYAGSDVQVLGVPVGKVTAVEPSGGSVRVEMRLDAGQRVAPDTGAVIVAPTLVSDRYVQLTQPWTDGPSLADGATIRRTAVPVEIDDLYQSLTDVSTALGPEGANREGALSDALGVIADNLDGQGASINESITNLSEASATVAGVDDDFFATVRNLETFNDTLLQHDEGVARANRQLAAVSDYLADDRDTLARAVSELGGALSLLEDFVRDNRAALRSSVDGLRGPTRTLVEQRRSLAEAVRTIPLVLQNFVGAYDPGSGTLNGRGNLNELTVWGDNGNSARTSSSAPPLLLPGLEGGGR